MAKHSLEQLFRPRSVAILGASENNPWGRLVDHSLKALEFAGPVHLVNLRGGMVFGRQSFTSAAQIGEPVDTAFIAVPASGLADALEDMAAAGIHYGAIVSAGFAEIGPEGAISQARVFERAAALGLTLLGPNSLGYVNYVDRIGFGSLPTPTPPLANPRVALVSQSGATAGILTRSAYNNNISLSYAVAMGNEAQIGLADVVDFLIADETTRSIAIFAETIRDPRAFTEVARRALAAKKPIVMLKVGVGELAAAVAQAHTGALVGDDRIFGAFCAEYGIVRVDTLEQLLATADFLAFTGVLEAGKKFAVASISGGACEMIADRGDDNAVPFARFEAATVARLKLELPSYGSVHNPLDITGAAMADTDLFRRSLVAMGPDPEVGLVGVCFELPASAEAVSVVSIPALSAIARGIGESGIKGFLLQQTIQPITGYGHQLAADARLPYVASGIGQTMASVGAAFAWSDKVRAAPAAMPAPQPLKSRPQTERQTLDVLAGAKVPVVPARVVNDRAGAQAAAQAMGGPVALKILSPDIQHKTEVGGVRLNLAGDEAVGDAYDAMMASVSAAMPKARIDGVIVAPMRSGGLELFVGIARDPSWGLAMVVGFGGVLVELLQDHALRLLPVSPDGVREMLGQLRGARLLDGYRGAPAVDIEALARTISRIGEVARALGPNLASLEINPLWVNGSQVECLDALAVWNP